MDTGTIIGIVIASIAVVAIIIALAMVIYFNKKITQLVKENSVRLKKQNDINQKTKFNTISKTEYTFSQSCNSKRQLDKFSIYDFFIAVIEKDYNVFMGIYLPVAHNIKTEKQYLKALEEIKTEVTDELCKSLKISKDRFVKREEELFEKNIIKPTKEIRFYLYAYYISPKGQNRYIKEANYTFADFEKMLFITKSLIDKKQTRQYQIKVERAKLSDSLRYDVLKRDGFKCQICGSSANDGVKLHVDHIIPVSKGGKTELSNLRTLCDRCNMGKSNKIEKL